jgi:hypothetical protein
MPPPRVVRVTPVPRYRLQITFDDGVTGMIDLAGERDEGVFKPPRDEALFERVDVDAFGAVAWPGGPDLAPDALYEEISAAQAADARLSAFRPDGIIWSTRNRSFFKEEEPSARGWGRHSPISASAGSPAP